MAAAARTVDGSGVDRVGQQGEAPLVFSTLGLRVVVVVRAKKLWIELGPVIWVRAVAAVKCLVNGFYRLLDGVLTTTCLLYTSPSPRD